MSDKKDQGVIKELQEFFVSSKNFMVNCQKPDAKGNWNYSYIRIFLNC